LKPWQRAQGCIPDVNWAFVWRMEDLLDLYAEPYDPSSPVVCFDESPYQLVGHTRTPVPGRPGHPPRYDYQYRREGTCNLFLFFEPRRGWRHVHVTARRTKTDFAHCMRFLVDGVYPEALRIRVVLDNLNIHIPQALYETFPPEEARRLLRKLEFHYTPVHGSWLNMVEVEFAVLSGQCLDRRLDTISLVRHVVWLWEAERNARAATVNWRFTIPDARIKLTRLYGGS
jgi:hypothetical protein